MPDAEYRSRQKRRSNYSPQIKHWVLIFICFVLTKNTIAQNYLNQLISLDVKEERLSDVLDKISRAGGFYFSYASSVIPKQELVSLSVQNKSVEDVLNILLNDDYEFKEAPNYIILRLAPNRMQLIFEETPEYGMIHSISGYVVDDLTGKKLANASVYEKNLLLSTLTDDDGYFKIRFKNPINSLALTVSKEYYRDTTIVLLATVLVNPGNKKYGYKPGDDILKVERTAFGRLLVSSKQKLQSLNLGGFFANTPFQTSLTPGLSSHGSMSGQVVNNFSLNLLGGYTSGVNGFEIGGGFNINKRDVNFVQAGGIFNLVGGDVNGFQIAGANNTVLENIHGVQAAGLYNNVKGKMHGFQLGGAFNVTKKEVKGVQVGGLFNMVNDSLKGVQIAGGLNFVKKEVNGIQISALSNRSPIKTKGVQLAGLLNYSKNLNGVQIGLINIADTSSGVSIGVFNFIRGGYKKLSISNNEFAPINLSFKLGNAAFYSIITTGVNFFPDNKAFVFGIGFGHDFIFNKYISLSSELHSQNVYLGDWVELNNLYRAKALINFKLSKQISVFVGPALNVFVMDQEVPVSGFKNAFPLSNYRGKQFTSKLNSWIGWEVGITLF